MRRWRFVGLALAVIVARLGFVFARDGWSDEGLRAGRSAFGRLSPPRSRAGKGLDDAAFFAVSSVVRDVFVLTASFTVYLTRPVTGGVLRAEGRVTSRSKNLYVAESVLYLEPDRQVARGSGTFMRSQLPLTEELKYR